VTRPTHPLFDRLLPATGFRRRSGVLLLVVTLPDGTPGTIPAAATGILAEGATEVDPTVLSADGFRRFRELCGLLGASHQRRNRPQPRK
jgi:hypothetical protein